MTIVILWAACCLAFLAFLCASELTVPEDSSFNPSIHFSWGYLAVDVPTNPTALSVRLKTSKMDPFQKSITQFINWVPSNLCPLSVVLVYLGSRGKTTRPLFILKDDKPLIRQRFVATVRNALHQTSVAIENYANHSFRIVTATSSDLQGLEDSTIQTLGRWRSLAYLEYIRIPRH